MYTVHIIVYTIIYVLYKIYLLIYFYIHIFVYCLLFRLTTRSFCVGQYFSGGRESPANIHVSDTILALPRSRRTAAR